MIHRVGIPITKTRSTVITDSGPKSQISTSLIDGHTVSEGGPYSFATSTVTETITSTNRLNSRDGHANNCLHTRETTGLPVNKPNTWLFYTAANPTVRSDQYDNSAAVGQLLVARDQALAQFGPTGSQFLRNNAINLITANFDRLRPDLTEVSVPNFLLDFKDISKLMHLWKYRKPLIKNLANANLNYQFGWRPTISDVGHMVSAVRNLKEKIDAFQKRQGRLSSKRLTVATGSEAHAGVYSGAGYVNTWSAVQTYTCTAHIAYRPLPIAGLTSFSRALRGVLDSWGFELNAEILWDAIPFSFVVDWFLDVGLIAKQFRLDTLELPIKLEDSYLQFKETLTVDNSCEIPATSEHTHLLYPGASWERVTFHRLSARPDYSSLITSGWRFPSLNQAVLGLSLGLTRL